MQRQPLEKPVVLQLPIMYRDPGRSLTYVYLYVDNLEIFDRIRKGVGADGISCKLLYTYYESGRNKYFGALVLDSTSARISLAQEMKDLDRMPGVEIIDTGETGNGLAASHKHLLQVVGTPVAIFARELIGNTYRQLVEAQGAQMEVLLFRIGESVGRHAASGVPSLANALGVKVDPQLLRQRFYDLQVFGWGEVVSLQATDDFSGEVLLNNDFEATAWHGKANSPKCNWLRGFLTGALSTLQGQQFDVTEPECQAKGDAHCRMLFRPSLSQTTT